MAKKSASVSTKTPTDEIITFTRAGILLTHVSSGRQRLVPVAVLEEQVALMTAAIPRLTEQIAACAAAEE